MHETAIELSHCAWNGVLLAFRGTDVMPTIAGGGRHGSNVNYVRHVPKFLQGHMHLLGKGQDSSVEEQLTAKKALPDTWDSEEDDEVERQVVHPQNCAQYLQL